MKKEDQREIFADILERLIDHFQKRNDVQNIDIMNLTGFCRNCLSKWYVNAAKNRNISVDYEKAREIIYGMPYSEWKKKYQINLNANEIEKLKKK